ncbi:MAG: hypothetical protein ACLQIK_04380 [Mycobacterium sp.]|uniref:hypothetical protein n=1 Tax=Mycobacterium sp. TaxID=1785 RepID=UPI003F9539F8
MNERTFWRVGAVSGGAFVVLSVLSTFLYPYPPAIDSDPAGILEWAHPHRVGIQAGMVLGAFTGALFVVFVAPLRDRIDAAGDRALGSLLYGSGIAFAAVYVLGVIPLGTLVFMEGQPGGFRDGTVVRLLFDLNWTMFAPAMALGVVFLLSTGIAIVRTEVFSPLLGWASIGVSVPVALLVYISLTFSSYHGGAWTVIGWVGFIGKLAVILWMSLAMARQPKNVNQTSAGAREDT